MKTLTSIITASAAALVLGFSSVSAQNIGSEDLIMAKLTPQEMASAELRHILLRAMIEIDSRNEEERNEGIKRLDEILNIDPKIAFIDSSVLSEAYLLKGNYSINPNTKKSNELNFGLLCYSQALAFNPNNQRAKVNYLMNYALKMKLEGNIQEAIFNYENAALQDPAILDCVFLDFENTYEKLMRKKSTDKKIKELNEIAEKYPDSYLAFVYLCYAHNKKKDIDGAKTAMEKALANYEKIYLSAVEGNDYSYSWIHFQLFSTFGKKLFEHQLSQTPSGR